MDLPRYTQHQSVYVLSQEGEQLTTSIRAKVTPAIIEICLLRPHHDGLDLPHLARRRPQILELGHQLDEAFDKRHGRVDAGTLMLAVGEGRQGSTGLVSRVELGKVNGLGGLGVIRSGGFAACFAL